MPPTEIITSQSFLELDETNWKLFAFYEELQFKGQDGIDACSKFENNTELKGPIDDNLSRINANLTENQVINKFADVQAGGYWRPTHCAPRHKIGVDLFNRGLLLNVGFSLADKLNVDCVIFHDVDMVPQSDRIPYGCPETLLHMGAYVDTRNYEIYDNVTCGGVLSIRMHVFKKVNGFSNKYWGWGYEDDDFGSRLLAHKFEVKRPNQQKVRYTMFKHVKSQKPDPLHQLYRDRQKRLTTDGLNDRPWNIIKILRFPLYYRILVDPGASPVIFRKA